MEDKQVPWWRKALNIAVNGILSGFGLFSKAPKPIDETEPATAAGEEEIRKEAELTEGSPELNSIEHEAARSVEVAVASQPEFVGLPELTVESEPATEDQARASAEAVEVTSPEEASSDEAAVEASDPEPKVELKPEPEIKAVFQEVPEPAGVPESIIETPAVVFDLTPYAAGGKGAAEHVSATPEEVGPEVPAQEPPPEPSIEDTFEQVTEPEVTVENVNVDERTPQAESALNETSTAESASPVPDEMVDPEIEAEEKIEDPVEMAAFEEADPNAEEMTEEIVAGVAEPHGERPVEQGNIIEGTPERRADEFVDQIVEESMELNSANSEPLEEHEHPAATSSPLPPDAGPANAPEPHADDAAVDEPEAPAAVTATAQHPSRPFIKLEAKEGEANASPFSVIVSQVYDGPLDLLLDLIRKQDIDIYDIPIARITAQFLSYVNQLKASDVDVAGEFIYTASLLIHIKSKMLLPRAPSGPDDAAEDPRRELVERLLEHERFKNAAQMLQQKQMLEAATWTNPGVREFKEDASAEPEIAADTVDLVRVFREILERARNRPVLNVEEDSVTVGQMIQFLSRRLSMEDHPIALRKLLSHSRSERALIAMFLALLELVRLQAILLRQDLAFSEIFIKKHSNFESVMTEGVAHDDWK
jgi:segregation and condensation protein A